MGPAPKASLKSWVLAGVILVLGVLVAGIMVSNHHPPAPSAASAESPTTVLSLAPGPPIPPPPSAGPPPRSQLVDLTLPAGSTPIGDSSLPGIETWKVPLSYDDTVSNIRGQLPVTQDYEGLRWCAKNTKVHDFVEWTWGTHEDLVGVTVSNKAGDTEVTITRGPDPAGC